MSDVQFGRAPAHRQVHAQGRREGKASRPSLLDRLGAPDDSRSGAERDAGPTGSSRKRGPPHRNVAGMFNNSRRSSVVRIRPSKQAKQQTFFTESEFFAADDGELERDKENLRADPPSSGRTQPSWKATSTRPEDDFVTPNRAATLVEQPNVFDFGVEEVEEVGEGEEEEERRARDDLLEEMGCHQPTISGKLLERQQLIQQIVASCLRTAGVNEVEIRAEKAAAVSYMRCRKISSSRQGQQQDGFDTDRRASGDYFDAAQGSKQAMAYLQDFYDQSASPEKFDRRRGQAAPLSGPGPVQRASAVHRPAYAQPTTAAREPEPPKRRTSQVVRNMLAQQPHGAWQDVRALGVPERASPAAWMGMGMTKMPSRQISPATPGGMFAGQSALLGPPGMLSADETIAQSMMLPDVVTP